MFVIHFTTRSWQLAGALEGEADTGIIAKEEEIWRKERGHYKNKCPKQGLTSAKVSDKA